MDCAIGDGLPSTVFRDNPWTRRRLGVAWYFSSLRIEAPPTEKFAIQPAQASELKKRPIGSDLGKRW